MIHLKRYRNIDRIKEIAYLYELLLQLRDVGLNQSYKLDTQIICTLANHFGCTEEHARRVCIRLKRQSQVERIKRSIKLGRPVYVYTAKTFPTSGV